MQGGTKARTGAYEAVREDAGLKFQRRRRPLSTDQGRVSWLDSHKGMVEIFALVTDKANQPFP